MNKKITKVIITLVTMMSVVGMTGCSLLDKLANNFDATKYVKSIMDTTYLGESEDYEEITNSTSSEAQETFEQGLQTEAEYLAAYIGVDTLTDTTKAALVELLREIYAHSKYEVKDAVKIDDGYNVEVIIYPIDILEISYDDMLTYVEAFNERNDNYEFSDYTTEQFEDEYAAGMIEVISGYLDKIGNGDAISVTVKVYKDSEGLYTISDEDFSRLDEYVISY